MMFWSNEQRRMAMEAYGRALQDSIDRAAKHRQHMKTTRLDLDRALPREVQCEIAAAAIFAHNNLPEKAEAHRVSGGYGGLE